MNKNVFMENWYLNSFWGTIMLLLKTVFSLIWVCFKWCYYMVWCVRVCLRMWRFLCTCCDTCVCSAGNTASLWWRTALNSALLILSPSPSHMPSSPSSLTWVIAQSNQSLIRLTCNQSEVISSVYADQNMVAHSRCDAAHHPFSHLCYQVRTHF